MLWLAPLAVVAICAMLVVGLRSEPSGYVAAYSVFPHESCDVLDFSGGIVTLRTCCGDEPYGTYSRARWRMDLAFSPGLEKARHERDSGSLRIFLDEFCRHPGWREPVHLAEAHLYQGPVLTRLFATIVVQHR